MTIDTAYIVGSKFKNVINVFINLGGFALQNSN